MDALPVQTLCDNLGFETVAFTTDATISVNGVGRPPSLLCTGTQATATRRPRSIRGSVAAFLVAGVRELPRSRTCARTVSRRTIRMLELAASPPRSKVPRTTASHASTTSSAFSTCNFAAAIETMDRGYAPWAPVTACSRAACSGKTSNADAAVETCGASWAPDTGASRGGLSPQPRWNDWQQLSDVEAVLDEELLMYVSRGILPVAPSVRGSPFTYTSACGLWNRVQGFDNDSRAWWKNTELGLWFWEPCLPKARVHYVSLSSDDEDFP